MASKILPSMLVMLLAVPVLAEAQPRPLRVSQLNADPKKYDEQEVVLRAYFETDIDHYASFTESRAISDEWDKASRAISGELAKGARGNWSARDEKLDSDVKKYCIRVLNRVALRNKFGREYAVNKHTVSVRGFYIADAGDDLFGFGGCRSHKAGFLVTEVLRKED